MELVEVTQLDEALTAQLLAVWESAVTATHQFLTAAEMAAIKKYVPTALQQWRIWLSVWMKRGSRWLLWGWRIKNWKCFLSVQRHAVAA